MTWKEKIVTGPERRAPRAERNRYALRQPIPHQSRKPLSHRADKPKGE